MPPHWKKVNGRPFRFGFAHYGLVKFVFVLWTLKSFRFVHKFFSMLIVCIGHHIGKKLTGWPFIFGLANHGLFRFGLYLDFEIFLNFS